MDPFTQKMLEKAELRSKALGLTAPKVPLAEQNQETTSAVANYSPRKLISASGSSGGGGGSSTKITRQFSDKGSKENSDVNVEINITTPSNIQVEVEVQECEMDEQGNRIMSDASSESAKASLRDTSRSHLKRLGQLYSDHDLSSPIHRTESEFCEEGTSTTGSSTKPRPKLTRLAALADSIKRWEDDPSHPDYKHHRDTVHESAKPRISGTIPKKQLAPQPPKASPRKAPIAPTTTTAAAAASTSATKTKILQWDHKVMDALESQGYRRRETSTTKLVYDYADGKQKEVEKQRVEMAKPEPPKKVESRPAPTGGVVAGRAAAFEKSRKSLAGRNMKDPTELSLRERMAIFEKNKGNAPMPKTAFAAPAPSTSKIAKPIVQKDEPIKAPAKFTQSDQSTNIESKSTASGIQSTVAHLLMGGKTISESKIVEETRRQREEELQMLLNRHKRPEQPEQPIPSAPPMPAFNLSTGQPLQPKEQTSNKRRSGNSKGPKLSPFRSKKSSPLGDDQESVSPEVKSTLDDVKRIRVAPPKSGRLYPALSDIESTTATDSDQDYTTATVSASEEGEHHFQRSPPRAEVETYDEEEEDSYMDSEEAEEDNFCNSSLGREVMQRLKHNDSHKVHFSKQNMSNQSSASEEVSDVLNEMDEYLDEALEGDSDMEDEEEEQSTPKKGSISSDSFRYNKPTKKHVHYAAIDEESDEDTSSEPPARPQQQIKSPVKSELTVNPSDDNNLVTLVHTVSFYRRQQKTTSQNSTPVRKIVHSPRSKALETDETSDAESEVSFDKNQMQVQEKIKRLLDEVCKQQTIISQTSQALNLCAATMEFSGSTESVEGERHLLVATHRRQACLDEVQRLRVEGSLRPAGSPADKGRLTVKDIIVPLKQDYLRKLAANTINGHHLVCLLKYNEHVLATKTIMTSPKISTIRFPDVLQLDNVYADFKITMEIYGMTAQPDILPHEIKYHIAKDKKTSKAILTPKKKDSRLIMPPVQSPAGPNAVRTPALVQYGFVIFSLRDIQRKTWAINTVGNLSPLEGSLHMRVNCELSVSIDYRGFLTMYEDVSGFGAWHRRWCRLHGHLINYWKYPDDEKRKAPIGTIDLQNCFTKSVGLAPRDVCARLNTLLLEFRRAAQDGDEDSLTTVRQGKYTVIRYLLSADTKEEREEWTQNLNKTLALLRAWSSNK